MTTTPTPRFAVSHSVKGQTSPHLVLARSTGATISVVIPRGRYWTDYVYGTALAVVDSPCLLGILAYEITNTPFTGPTTVTCTKAYTATGIAGFYQGTFTYKIAGVAEACQVKNFTSPATDVGVLLSRRLGIDVTSDWPSSASGGMITKLLQGIWSPDRPEAGGLDVNGEAQLSTVETNSGKQYTTQYGSVLGRHLIEFDGIAQEYARARNAIPDASSFPTTFDHSFETLMWQWLSRGERVRYYRDSAAEATYLTTAMLKTDHQCIVAGATSFGVGDLLWVDGERVYITAKSAGPPYTLTVERANPVAHAKYAPASVDFVGTFVLGKSGGNVNRQVFEPARRGLAVANDKHDFAIALESAL